MKFDDNFLMEVGLQALPESQKKEFLAQAQEELEVRVGEIMCEGMSDEQLLEFEKLMENDQETIRKMVFELKEDFRVDPVYLKLLKKHGVKEGNWEILSEYLSVKWIDVELIPKSNIKGVHTPDIKMSGLKWEMKAPFGEGNQLMENTIQRALKQSQNIIVDLRQVKRHQTKCLRELKKQFLSKKSIKRLKVITKSGKTLDFER